MKTPRARETIKWWEVPLIIVLFIPIAPVLVAIGVFFVVFSAWIHIAIWSLWCFRGRDILFVYSDSPIWHDYIEQHVLPHLGERAEVLNCSCRKEWRFSLARMAFHHFGGYRESNPMAVVFRPFQRTRTFRFWQPFRDFKHGHPEALHQMEGEFFELIGAQRHVPPA